MGSHFNMKVTGASPDGGFVRLPLVRFTALRHMLVFPPTKAVPETSSQPVHTSVLLTAVTLKRQKIKQRVRRANLFVVLHR